MHTHSRGDGRAGERAHDVSRPPAIGLAAQKKSLHASERDTARVQQARADYRELIAPLDREHLKFIDESGVNLAMTRRYGRAPRGERVVGAVPQNYGANVTMLAALSLQGVEAVMTIDGATDAEVFRAYVEHVLGPTLTPGDIVIMDNLRAHKVAGIRERIEASGARLIYLPPYSPDLSPIEPCWSKLKTLLRTAQARTRDALDVAIQQVLAAVTSSDADGWFHHCGYALR
jgi:transposase